MPWLKKIDAQHPLQANGRAAALALGIMRFDDGRKFGPRDDFPHAGEELVAAGGLLFGSKLSVGKGGLAGQASLTSKYASSFKQMPSRIYSALP